MPALRAGVAVALSAGAVLIGVQPAHASGPPKFKNCSGLHSSYPHGVAKPGAHDVVRGSTRPVTTFVVNQRVYVANQRLDRDKDGVACEKS
jgi:hypothetical protein